MLAFNIFILLTVFISIITSILVGRFYLNRQYHKSNSGFRQSQVIAATKAIISALSSQDINIEAIKSKYKYSLGEVIEYLYMNYGATDSQKQIVGIPIFKLQNHSEGWEFYESVIRPVQIDINNNGFIGWLPIILNVKRMTTLWNLCYQIELIIMELEYIKALEKQHNIVLLERNENNVITLKKSDHKLAKKSMQNLLFYSAELQKTWYRWLQLM